MRYYQGVGLEAAKWRAGNIDADEIASFAVRADWAERPRRKHRVFEKSGFPLLVIPVHPRDLKNGLVIQPIEADREID